MTSVGSRLGLRWVLVVGSLCIAAAVALVASAPSELPVWKAAILGVVEGVTEYLPISSTGHLLVTSELLDLGDGSDRTALDTYVVAIQIGAIAAVIGLYRNRIAQIGRGVISTTSPHRPLARALFVAFVPVAALGALLEPTIKSNLFGVGAIAIAWAAGGAFLLIWSPPAQSRTQVLDAVSCRQAAFVGVAQAIALWPGVSRSLVTIVAALLAGLALSAAVELSFLLGLATLSAATAWDLTRNGSELIRAYGWGAPLAGALTAFVVATAAVAWLTSYLGRHDLRLFGWYRIIAAVGVIALVFFGAV